MKNVEFNRSLGFLFHIINLNMQKHLEQRIKKHGLSSSHQFGVLLHLSKRNMSQKEISNVTLAEEPSTTKMLDRMIKKEIIAKKRSEVDKRKQIVYITEKGKILLSKLIPIVSKRNTEFENLLDEDELEDLFKLLNKMRSRVNEISS